MLNLTIDRNKWARGGDNGPLGPAALYNSYGGMCCLGFLCVAAGFDPEGDLYEVGEPEGLNEDVRDHPEPDNPYFHTIWERVEDFLEEGEATLVDKAWLGEAIKINDDHNIEDEEREQRLTDLFAQQGIAVEFVG